MNTLIRHITLAAVLGTGSSAFAQVAGPTGGGTTPTVEVQPADADAREQALLLLSGYHGLPEREVFEQTLENPRQVLLEIARDEEAFALHRERASAALAWWPDEEVRQFWLGLLAAEDTGAMTRHRTLGLLATAFGEDALPVIAPYLGSDDVQLRLTAVSALAQIGTPAALELLEQAAQVEQSPVVLERLDRLAIERPTP